MTPKVFVSLGRRLYLHELESGEGLETTAHQHEHDLLILSGEVSVSIGPIEKTVKAGDIVRFHGEAVYGYVAGSRASILAIYRELP